jgi:YegS/Rv2252/BmrU family lipid kinase
VKAHFNSQTTALIVNPAAGGGRVGRRWKELESTIRADLGNIRIYLTQEIGDGIRLGEQAVRNGATTILSLGGDGTHGEVLNGLMATEPADGTIRMGILHAGTGGDFRRMLAHSDSLERCMEHLSRAGSNPIDIGSVSYISDAGMPETRYFLNLASAGLAGHIDRMVNESNKRFGGKATFYSATLRGLLGFQAPEMNLRIDGTELGSRPATNIMVANGRWAGGGMMFAPEAHLANGLLEVIVFHEVSMLQSLLLSRKLYLGTHTETSSVSCYRGREIVVESQEDTHVLMDIDGESPGRLPATFRVHPGAIRMLNVQPDFL